jgi:murein DD-endopeptidase MepM/ murein hydrolase activator NlpD
VVILEHPRSGLQTVYAHLQRPLVKEGQWVSRGQKIALSGQSGHASGPHLHFEIRKGVTAIDPAQVMTTQLAKRG